MKAVILAGGKGTRLRPLTYTKAKPMVPFLNKPVIEHIIEKLAGQGFDEIIVTTNYRVEQIVDYFGDGSNWGVELRVVDENKPLGTAGSVKNAVKHLDGTFVVIQGDNISEIDIKGLYEQHKKTDCMATISLMEVDDVSLFGIAEVDGSEIVRFKEKPDPSETFSNLANDGIYILEPEVLDMIPLAFYDFSRNLFPRMLDEGRRICGSVTHEFWRDVGTPRDYLEATHYFIKQRNLIARGCAVRDSNIYESVLGEGCSVTSAKIRNSVLFDGVEAGTGSRLKSCIVGSNCRIGENVDIWPGAVIGDDVEIGDGAIIKGDSQLGPRIKVPAGKTVNEVIVPDDVDTSE